jgi:5'-nucleotidase
MHLANSLRIPARIPSLIGCAAAAGLFVSACGATPAAQPTTAPAAPPASSPAAAPAPSPQRPALASPVASPSPGAAATASPTTSSGPGEEYEVKSGDTLLTIAEQFYGDGTVWRRIYDANRDVIGADPDRLSLGMKLRIPPKEG